MKMKAALMLLVAMISSQALADPAPRAEPPLFGTWAVDVARLPMEPQLRPKSVTISFSSEAGGRLRTRVVVVDPAGQQLLAEGVTPLDGTPTALEANFEADVSATTMPNPGVLIMQLGQGGMPASTRIYTLDPDPRTMTETVTYFGPDGKPVVRRNHFARVD